MDMMMLELFTAAKIGNLRELKKLKENGVNLSQRDKDGNTSLLWAVCYGQLDSVKLLLKEEGNTTITEKNNAGNTALLSAVVYGHLSLVQWLLNDGGSQLSEYSIFGNNSLFLAVNHSQLPILRLTSIWISLQKKSASALKINLKLSINKPGE